MSSPTILLETSPSGITTITLNRPSVLNALNAPLLNELVAALRQSLSARVIILQGAGDRAFCVGEDLKETMTPNGTVEEMRHALERLQDLTRLMATSPAIVITVVQGFAIGGGAEIALTGDFVIGGPKAQFKFPEVNIGHAATGGITQRLPILVGLLKAKQLLLSGRFVGAEESLRLGMLTEIASDPKARARELAKILSALPRTAVSSSKLSLERATFPTQEAVLQDELHVAALCFAQQDASKAFSNFASRERGGQNTVVTPRPTNLNLALSQAVKKHPARTFIRFGGTDHSFASFDEAVAQMAGRLLAASVEPGDRVLVMMRNSIDMIYTWFATNRLGAIWVPINPDLKGETLDHMVKAAKPKIALADAAYTSAIEATSMLPTGAIFTVDKGSSSQALPKGQAVSEAHPVSASTTSAFLFTSGTGGRSKACILSHGYFIQAAQTLSKYTDMTESDVLYCPFPLYHIDATALTVVPALLLGAVAAISARYSATNFWSEIRETRATVYDFMGATLALSYKQPPSPEDRNHSVRLAWGVPVPSWAEAYEKRFNHKLFEAYGSTEAGIPISQQGRRVPGSCGKAVEGFTVQILNRLGNIAAPNVEGNLVVRSDKPNAIFRGYYGDAEATVDTFVDSWLHTGDRAKMDEHGNVFYTGRSKDTIRRRGENINAFEVEEELLAHPDVISVAAFAVPSDLGDGTEEDLKVAVVPRAEAVKSGTFTEAALWEWAVQKMTRFQIPDVIEFVTRMERTSTGKIEKWKLNKDGGKSFRMKREQKL